MPPPPGLKLTISPPGGGHSNPNLSAYSLAAQGTQGGSLASVPASPQDEVTSISDDGTLSLGDLTIGERGMKIAAAEGDEGGGEGGAAAGGADAAAGGAATQDFQLDEIAVEGPVLGQGVSGTVRRVAHPRTGGAMALKVIPLDANEKVRKQVLLELRTLHACRCEQIVAFLGAFFRDGTISIALEFMDCGCFANLSKKVGRVPEWVLARTTVDILRGLKYLHKERHLIHRDIKPSNLLLNSEGRAKIADFGVSRQNKDTLSQGNDPTLATTWIGTVTYMSPERIQGQAYAYDSDVWSLALCLMECALGRYPYPPKEEGSGGKKPSLKKPLAFWDLLHYIAENPAPKLPRDEFSSEFCHFLTVCMEKKAADRPSASQLLKHPWVAKANAEAKAIRAGGEGQSVADWLEENGLVPGKRGK